VGEARPELGSQASFGKFLDASGPTVQAVELGKLELSDSLALRMTLRTGVNLFDLRRKAAAPRDLWGDPYSPASFEKVLSLAKENRKVKSAQAHIAATIRLAEALLEAAQRKGHLEMTSALLDMQIVKLMERFELAGTMTQLAPDADIERTVNEALAILIATRGKDKA